MKTIAAVLITSGLLIGGAYAQSPDVSPPATKHVDHSTEAQRHIVDLHAKLMITPAEESLWSAVAKTMEDNANQLDIAIDKREQADTTAVDDLKAYGDVIQAHADGVKKLSAVFSPLYASMSDKQKAIADDVFAKREHPGQREPQAMK